MIKLLWIPKSWKEFSSTPEAVYRTSNRLRAYNHHEHLASNPDVASDVLGVTIKEPDFNHFDILIFQKNLWNSRKAKAFRRKPGKLVVLDLCDPLKPEETPKLNDLVDFVICSNHELQSLLIAQGLAIPSATILDSHEADPDVRKTYNNSNKPLITWYGVGANYAKAVTPLESILNSKDWTFRWAAEENPKWSNSWGFTKGVQWQLSIQDAWRKKNSWQHFIQQSDIGIAPVFEAVKAPHKILNYMAYGIPVVCSPTDSHKRIIKHDQNGFFADSPEEWHHYLSLLRQPEIRNRLGNAARKTALEPFTPQKTAEQYITALTEQLVKKQSTIRKRFFGIL